MEVKKQQKPGVAKAVKTKEHFVWLGSYITIACICIAIYFLIRFNVIFIPGGYHDVLQKLSIAGFFAILILSASKSAEILILKKSRTKYKRYNLIRLTHLISLIAVGILII